MTINALLTLEQWIAVLCVWPLLVIIQTFIHAIMIEVKDQRPVYWQWTIIRGWFSIMHGIALNVRTMEDMWPVLLFQLSVHFVLFNPLLNFLRVRLGNIFVSRDVFWYLGYDSGWIDDLLSDFLPKIIYKILYFITVACIPVSIWWLFNQQFN